MRTKYFKQGVSCIVFLNAAIISHTQTVSACTSHDTGMTRATIKQRPLRYRFM